MGDLVKIAPLLAMVASAAVLFGMADARVDSLARQQDEMTLTVADMRKAIRSLSEDAAASARRTEINIDRICQKLKVQCIE